MVANGRFSIPTSKSKINTLLVFGVYVGLAVLLTWPAVTTFKTHLIGGRGDLWVHQWTFWWVKEALWHGQTPFFTNLLYYPHGVPLTSHNIAWFNIGLWLPLQSLLGSITAYNILFLGTFALNGFAMYLLAREFTHSRAAAFVGGVIFGFWPYTMSHYDHPNMIVIFWTPLALLFLHRTVVGHRRWDPIAAGLFLALQGITRWQLLLMSSPIFIAYTLYALLVKSTCRPKTTIFRLGTTAVLALLLMIPVAIPLVADQFTRDYPEDVFISEPDGGRTDLLAYLVSPDLYDRFWQAETVDLNLPRPYEHIGASVYYIPFLGFTTLILALLGILKRWRQARFWLFLALFYMLFAIGSQVAVNGRLLDTLPLPYTLLEGTLLSAAIRRPHRLNLFLSVPMALMAAWGMVFILNLAVLQRRKSLVNTLLTLGIAGLILWEYNQIPFTTTEPFVPEWYHSLANQPEAFGTLDLPINDRFVDKWYMYYQTTHGKPMATGHVSRMPREAFELLDELPFVQTFLNQEQVMDVNLIDVTNQLRPLADANIRYLVIHKRFVPAGIYQVWQDWLTYAPAHEDDDLIVYHTAPQFGVDYDISTYLSEDIGLISVVHAPVEAVQNGLIKVDARLGTQLAPGENDEICLALVEAEKTRLTHCQVPVPGFPTAAWQANEVVRGQYTLAIPDFFAPGDYELALWLQHQETKQKTGETAVLGSVTIHPYTPAETTTAEWGESIHLQGYQWHQSAEQSTLTLYWQATQPITPSYKIFVHLLSMPDGELVAQQDFISRDWTYPTYAWTVGETVQDVVRFSPESLPDGDLEIRIGFYNDATGETLSVQTDPAVANKRDYFSIFPGS